MKKHCNKCGQDLEATEFYRRSDRAGILRPICKKCHNLVTNGNRAKRNNQQTNEVI